ncbi:MAG: YfhO family protein [Vampirovibrionales bacterium]|nr:YfhO family protein [Vampirovibrionales bacterium]
MTQTPLKTRNPRLKPLEKHAPWLAILVCWLVYWLNVITGTAQLYIRDLTFYATPMKTFLLQRIKAGQFPLWTPHIGAGMPYFADLSNQVLYPGNLLFFIAPSITHALSWYALLHVLLGMFSVYLLARTVSAQSLNRLNAVWAALLYGFSGYVLTVTCNINYLPVIVFAPLGLWAFVRGLETRSFKYSALLAFCLSMMILGGDVYDPFLMAGFTALIGLIALKWPNPAWTIKTASTLTQAERNSLQTPETRLLDWRFFWVHWGGSLALTGLLCAVQLLPTAELLSLSVRQEPLSYTEAMLWSFPPQRLIEFIHPFFYGSKFPSPHFIGQFLYPQFREAWADSVYLGVIPVLCAAVALLTPYKSHRFWAKGGLWEVILIGSLCIAFGHFAFWTPWLIKLVPFLQSQRYPEKALIWTTLSLCLLAAQGLQTLQINGLPQSLKALQTQPQVIRIAFTLGILGLATVLTLGLPAEAWIWPHALESSIDWLNYFYQRSDHINRLLVHFILISLPLVSIVWLPLAQKRLINGWRLGLVTLAVLDLMLIHVHQIPIVPTAFIAQRPVPQVLETLAQHEGVPYTQLNQRWRVFSDQTPTYRENYFYQSLIDSVAGYFGNLPPGSLRDSYTIYWPYRVAFNLHRMLPNSGAIYGLRYLNGNYSPLELSQNALYDKIALQNKPERMFALANVKYALTQTEPTSAFLKNSPEGFQKIGEDTGLNMDFYQIQNTVPRAYLSTEALYNNDPYRFLILSNAFDAPQNWTNRVELETDQPWPGFEQFADASGKPEAQRLNIKPISPEHWQFRTQTAQPLSHIVLTESFYPGWQAQLDGKTPLPVYKANHRFMAIPVPQGTHTLDLFYTCQSLAPGLALSGLGLLLCLCLLNTTSRRWLSEKLFF